MREDLIAQWREHKDLTHIFVTTFNIDLLFIENILLRELRACGHPRLTILADEDEVVRSYRSQGRYLSQLGRRYRVVPVRMGPGFRFHPKLILLAGRQVARVYVGSGNLGFGGMRLNEELWTRFDSALDGAGTAEAARQFLTRCLAFARRSSPVLDELTDAFDPSNAEWATPPLAPSSLEGRAGDGAPLFERMATVVEGVELRRIVIGAPYFDEEGAALAAFGARWPNVPIDVLVPAERSTLTARAWAALREPKRLRAIESRREGSRSPFIHAKLYGFEGPSETIVFIGSANCTRAALLLSGRAGNAELLASSRVDNLTFTQLLEAGLREATVVLPLPASIDEAESDEPLPTFRVLSAHLDATCLQIELSATDGVQAPSVIVDGQVVAASEMEEQGRLLRVKGVSAAHRVEVEGIRNGTQIRTPPHWVDCEPQLRFSSSARRLTRTIADSVTPSRWNHEAWAELLRLLGEHTRTVGSRSVTSGRERETATEHQTSAAIEDYLSSDYRLRCSGWSHDAIGAEVRLSWLRDLLFECMGVPREEDDQPSERIESEEESEGKQPPNTSAPPQNQQSKQHPTTRSTSGPSVREKKKLENIANRIVDQLLTPNNVAERPAALLAQDLSVLAVLLVSGQASGWLSPECFCQLTHRSWLHLFFDDGRAPGKEMIGAIVRRRDTTPSAEQFDSLLATPNATAALATWSLACPDGGAPVDRARFRLASRLAIAKAPWLWALAKRDEVERSLQRLCLGTSWLGMNEAPKWSDAVERWNATLEEGLALRRIDPLLHDVGPADLSRERTSEWIEPGTLLWQGPRLGFCILQEAANPRSPSQSAVRVQAFRLFKPDAGIKPDFVRPFRAVVSLLAKRNPSVVSDDVRTLLLRFTADLELVASGRGNPSR